MRPRVAILDTGGANITSIQFALDTLDTQSVFTSNLNDIESASHIILPGVGSAKAAMEHIRNHELLDVILSTTKPVLGICLGMQLLFSHSTESNTNDIVTCLGILSGDVQKIDVSNSNLTLPHMGWNKVTQTSSSPLFNDIPNNAYFYFANSYHGSTGPWTRATTTHGSSFTVAIEQNNFHGVQFHPERSGNIGQKLLKNFLLIG